MSKHIRKAIFPVGGLGTRFLPATKAMPKEMLPVIDKPLIQYAVEEALASGIEQLIFVTGRGKTAIEDHFDHSYELEDTLEERGKLEELEEVRSFVPGPGQISYVRQQKPLGLGHAVWCARHLIDEGEPFAVILADDLIKSQTPCLKQMIEAYPHQGSMMAVMEVPEQDVSKYGIFDVSKTQNNCIFGKGLVEKPTILQSPSRYAVIGRYILSYDVMMTLNSQEPGKGGEIQLTDAIARTIQGDNLSGLLFEGTRFDCGSKEGMLEATLAYALDRNDLRYHTQRLINFYNKKVAV
ncbi:UTP--glucose-1-phosphate uridylyltransferase [Candidatus Bealeia paramacronuclearis]|uniref:UTP--glucose-1-phosphate uridylyltransferase n=1 Tax=Candidatus Bealeia paramacronuclearis TaxID=1921001 RepID=A0ABZ2C537_9PROT|nr:UTP--glucose-1-phosphate uridylyltransferase [Candidatus Bealeia paramacronuclearis]